MEDHAFVSRNSSCTAPVAVEPVERLTLCDTGIGQQFALTELALITFRLLQAFKSVERQDDRPMVVKLGATTSLLHGCWVAMTRA